MSDDLIVVFDGSCNLCRGSVDFVRERDRRGRFRFVAAQSDEGAALQREHGIDALGEGTLILIAGGRAHVRSEAAWRIARELEGPWRGWALLRFVPRWLRDRVYDLVARNRRHLHIPGRG